MDRIVPPFLTNPLSELGFDTTQDDHVITLTHEGETLARWGNSGLDHTRSIQGECYSHLKRYHAPVFKQTLQAQLIGKLATGCAHCYCKTAYDKTRDKYYDSPELCNIVDKFCSFPDKQSECPEYEGKE
jgi:hypothetical protein